MKTPKMHTETKKYGDKWSEETIKLNSISPANFDEHDAQFEKVEKARIEFLEAADKNGCWDSYPWN